MIRNPATKAIVVTVLFALFGLVGVLFVPGTAIPSFVILYVLLLVHTYFSVRCFSALVDAKNSKQNLVDLALVISYFGLAMSLTDASFWIWWIILFLFAALKYSMLIGHVAHPRLLRRKLVADLGGAFFGVLFVFAAYLFETVLHINITTLVVTKLGGLSIFEWISVLVFGGATIYYFFVNSLYVHDDKV